MMIIVFSLGLFGAFYVFIFNTSSKLSDHITMQTTPQPTEQFITTPPPTPTPVVPSATPKLQYTEAVWIGAGDIMSHKPQLPGSYIAAEQRYNFDPIFANVAPILKTGDFVMANLETPIAGKDVGYSGYPLFNAPDELAEALKHAGFNILSTANNHSLDQGEQGLLQTMKTLDKLDVHYVGTALSDEMTKKQVIVEKNNITMGLLAYTYGTNGIAIPAGKPYLVNLIDEQKIKSDITQLKDAGVDIITVALHFGIEYDPIPSEEQKQLARKLVDAGADIIAGSHPHVIQPYEVIETFTSAGKKKKALIIYSLGNFISNQRGDTKDYGVLYKVNLKKELTSNFTELTDITAIPTWVHRYKPDQYYRYRILPVEQVLQQQQDPLLAPNDYKQLKSDFAMLKTRLESMKQ
ncbi:CapA family protein [Paenibacillus yanchengensis]